MQLLKGMFLVFLWIIRIFVYCICIFVYIFYILISGDIPSMVLLRFWLSPSPQLFVLFCYLNFFYVFVLYGVNR